MSLQQFKINLARALDDNLHTRQWHNLVDYLIVFMILLSTVEIFLSTFDVHPVLRRVLLWVDIGTLAFFTVEVALRIWVAPLIDPRFNGLRGRLRYCFSFYGFIDIASTFPFYLQWLIPLPFGVFKILRTARVVRLFRISRYMKSFRLLNSAISQKRHELFISMQFLLIITVILSLMLFFFEHEVQPEVYSNGFVSVLWAFAQYIGDPGQFADTPPVTFWGRVIACIVGLLGIAIVAVPAGIIGAGFTEAIEDDKHQEEVETDAANLRLAFQRKLDRPTGMQVVPPFRSVTDLKARLNMKDDNLFDAVYHGPGFRLVNLASTIPAEKMPTDRLAVEHFEQNRPYGFCADRGSRITIISPASVIDACVGNFAYYVALIGGFNYISREIGGRAEYKSFYGITDETVEGFAEYKDDLLQLMNRDGAWGITILAASGALEPEYDTHIHVNIGGPKGDTRTSGPDLFVRDEAAYKAFYADLAHTMCEQFNLQTDHQKYHNTSAANNFARCLPFRPDASNVIIRFEWHKMLWDPRHMAIARTLAEVIARDLARTPIPDNPALRQKAIGFDGY